MYDVLQLAAAGLGMIGIPAFIAAVVRGTIPLPILMPVCWTMMIAGLLSLMVGDPLETAWIIVFGIGITAIGARYAFAKPVDADKPAPD